MLLATDLDGTFLGGSIAQKQQLYQLIRNNPDIKLVFVTGRGLETVLPLIHDPAIPNPDFIIADVGATVIDGTDLRPMIPIQGTFEESWPGKFAVKQKLTGVSGLLPQEVPQQRRCSFYYDETTDIAAVRSVADELGCDLLTSAGKYLDILPKGVNKGTTLQKLLHHIGFPEHQVLVAGDTFNDHALFTTGYKGVAVGASEQRLLDAVQQLPNVHVSDRPGAGGILDAIFYFPEFGAYQDSHETTSVPAGDDSKQLLMVYHRLPFDTEIRDGKPRRIPPRSPNGIIPSLLVSFQTAGPASGSGKKPPTS